jgi:DNA-binding CsgD family transcriptional regulator
MISRDTLPDKPSGDIEQPQNTSPLRAALLDKSVVSPVLIGRAAYIETLDRAMDETRSHGKTILIAGEAGVGKTRLVREIKKDAAAQGLLTLEGNAFEPDRALAYAPLIDLLRRFLASHPKNQKFLTDLGSDARPLARLVPDIARLLPRAASASALEPEEEKRRLYLSLTQFFSQLAKNQSLLIVFEDVHWSDDSSLDFLLFLAQRIASRKILLVLTYRSEQTLPSLDHLLAELDREDLAAELVLTSLNSAQTDALIRTIFDLKRPIRGEFLEPIYGLTEGNPFFIEEILKSLLAAGEIFHADGVWDRKPMHELHFPRSIQEAVQRRIAHLSEGAQRTLEVAAIADRAFSLPLLVELTYMDEPKVVQVVKELIRAQLVVEESADQFAFRHALTREAVYGLLLKRERKVLHQRVAETLERMFAESLDSYVADLAYHYHAAESWEKALEYALRAGERSQSMFAPREAIEQFTRAIESAHKLARLPEPALLRARGQAHETIGDFEQARADYEQAWDAARAAHDRMAEWQALLDLGFLWASRDYAKTGDYFQQALAHARSMNDPRTLGHTLNRVGNWYVNIEQPHVALGYHQEALNIFQELDDRAGLAETFDLLGLASEEAADGIQMTDYYSQAIALFRELDDRVGLSSSLLISSAATENYFTSTCVAAPITLAEAMAQADEALRLAREIGWRAGECFSLGTPCLSLGAYGEYDQALARVRGGLRIAEEIEHRQWIGTLHSGYGAVLLDLLALSEARRHLEQSLVLSAEVHSLIFLHMASGFLASTCVLQNDLSRAESVLDAALGLLRDRFRQPTQAQGNTPLPTVSERLCLAADVELALARGDGEPALSIVENMINTTPNLTPATVIPRLSKLRGEALTRLKRFEEAESVLTAAMDVAAARGLRPMLWRIHHALGKLYQAQDRRNDAHQQFADARAIVQELADGILDVSIKEEFLRGADALLPRPRALTSRRAAKQQFGGLTEREREIAALIAEGKSNREIADKLVLSERTVITHVSSILNKLGFASRTQIAVWAAEQGLSQPHVD